jgi:hypothetical protein
MIRIAITQAAYDAIAATLRLGSVGYEAQRSDTGKVFIWLERRAMDRLEAERLRGRHHHQAGKNGALIRHVTRVSRAALLRDETLHGALEFTVLQPKE